MVRSASETPYSALAFAERAGIPAGAFSVVTGPAQPVGDALLASPTTRALSFTGSTEVGRRLLAGGLSGSDATDEVVTGFGHGWTYSAHPTCVAAALANLDFVEREDLLGNVREVGPYLLGALRDAVGTIRWSARCAASACWPCSSSSRTRARSGSSSPRAGSARRSRRPVSSGV